MSQDCPVRTILAVLGFAAGAGVPPPDLLAAAALDPTGLADPDAYVRRDQEVRLWDEAVRLTGDPDFGLHLAEWVARFPPDHFDVLVFATRSSPTLREHYRLAARYVRLFHEGIYLRLEEEGEVARLVHGHSPEQVGPRQPIEGMLALTLLHGRASIGEDFAPREVHFTHARPARVSEHERVFRAPLLFGCPRNALVLERSLLDRPQLHAEPRLLAILDRQLGAMVSALPESRSFQEAVTRCMLDDLPEREPVVAAVARRLHMSARSLQRRLESEGTSFSEVLSELRRERALRYLRDPRISIAEVAFLLGFLDVTAFHRAFKRWEGTTPAEYRRSVQRER